MNTTHQDAVMNEGHQDSSIQEKAPRQAAASHAGFRDPRRKSSFLASLLSIIPGLGQVYVGYYRRGFYNILIFGSVFSLLVSTQGQLPFNPLGVMFLIFFEFYNIIDAGRRATLFNLSLEGYEQIDLPDELTNKPMAIEGSYLFGGLLLLFGLIALSNTLFGYTLQWLKVWWPLLPIGFGVYLVTMAYLDSNKAPDTPDKESE